MAKNEFNQYFVTYKGQTWEFKHDMHAFDFMRTMQSAIGSIEITFRKLAPEDDYNELFPGTLDELESL